MACGAMWLAGNQLMAAEISAGEINLAKCGVMANESYNITMAGLQQYGKSSYT